MKIVPSGDSCGAEVRGVDVSKPLEAGCYQGIRRALADYGMLVFRDQQLAPSDQIAFSKGLGEPDLYSLSEYRHADHPEILLVSNIKDGGRNIGLADAGMSWHTDSSYIPEPPAITILYALEVPEADDVVLGDTLFANTAEAYDALPTPLQARLDGLAAIHSYVGKHAHRAKLGRSDRNKPKQEEQDALAPVEHPIVRHHPITGRKCLFVSVGECIAIPGLGDDEALSLIDDLALRIKQPQFQHRHHWRAGDLVAWDNCLVQHMAIKDYDLPLRRLMHRTQVKGPRPA